MPVQIDSFLEPYKIFSTSRLSEFPTKKNLITLITGQMISSQLLTRNQFLTNQGVFFIASFFSNMLRHQPSIISQSINQCQKQLNCPRKENQ